MARFLLPFFIAGCSLTLTVAAPRYELVTKVSTKPMGMDYSKSQWAGNVQTTYSYYEVYSDGSKTLRWRRTESGKCAAHWISPSGRVWIMSEEGWDSLSRSAHPMGQSRSISLREVSGDVLGRWSGPFVPSKPKKSEPPIATGAGKAIVLRPRVAEQLELRQGDGSLLHLTAFWIKGRTEPFRIQQRLGSPQDKPNILESIIANPGYEMPSYEKPFGWRNGFLLWRAKPLAPGLKDQVWIAPQQIGAYGLLSTGKETILDHYPDSVEITPGGFILLFDFFGNTGRMTVVNYRQELNRVDLVSLGKFGSAAEAKASLKWKSPLVRASGGWTPASQVGIDSTSAPEQVELSDTRGRRFLITLNNTPLAVKTEAFSGYLARRPKDPYIPPMWKKLSEKIVASHNGRYKLRLRRFTVSYAPSMGSITLLAVLPNKQEVEMWNTTTYQDVPYMGVTDSGRTVILEVGTTNMIDRNDTKGHIVPYTQFRILAPDGRSLGGADPLVQWGLKSVADLRARVAFRNIKFEPIGKTETGTIDGVSVSSVAVEVITVPIKNGQPQVYYIMRNTGMGQEVVAQDQPWVRSFVERARKQSEVKSR